MATMLTEMRKTTAMFETQMKRQAQMIDQQGAVIQQMAGREAAVSPVNVAAPEVQVAFDAPAGERPIRFEIEYDDDDENMVACVPVYASDLN